MENESRLWAPGLVMSEGQPISLGGINPWKSEWIKLDESPIQLPHPSYKHQSHKMWIYRIQVEGCEVVFAAGELSANVWGFYEQLSES